MGVIFHFLPLLCPAGAQGWVVCARARGRAGGMPERTWVMDGSSPVPSAGDAAALLSVTKCLLGQLSGQSCLTHSSSLSLAHAAFIYQHWTVPELTLLQAPQADMKWLFPSSRRVISHQTFLGTPLSSIWRVPAAANSDTWHPRVKILFLKNKLMQFHRVW